MSDAAFMPPLIVCERTGRWAVAIRAAFGRRNRAAPPIVETRSPAQLQATVVERRRRGLAAGPLVVELTPGDARRACDTAMWHVRWGDHAPLVMVVTDGDRGDGGDYEAVARAAGATSFVGSLAEVDEVVDTYTTFVADATNRCTVPHDDERSTTQRIWDALPWSTS